MQRREELNCCLFPFIEKHIRFETKFLMKGDKCNSPEYLEVKKDFRYPGELLERMELPV